MKYRAEIDGLRALAVVPVILFHAGFELFGGGFVGVDVFFVISGYLITTILIEEIENKRFSIVNFYERRARRILPALFFVMLVCIPFAWIWMLPSQMKDFSQSLVAVSLFASNILFWRESGYFDSAAEEKPLLHTWSLAVEEQYYVLFPIFLILAWRFGKNRVFWMIVVMAAISLLLSEWGWRNKAAANFYLAPTRAWELFAGSIAAFIVQKQGVQKNNPLATLGLAAIIFSIFFYDETTPFPSVYALVPVIGVVLLVLYAEKDTLAAKILSTKGFVGIGLISYSAYLWHQPLFAFAKIQSESAPSDLILILLVVSSLILAYFSWQFVEMPFRNKNTVTRKRVFFFSSIGIVTFLVIGLLGHKTDGFMNQMLKYKFTAAEGSQVSLVFDAINYDMYEKMAVKDCNIWVRDTKNIDARLVDDCFEKHGNAVVVLGDSHAMNLFNIMSRSNAYPFLIGVSQGGCRPHNNRADCHYDNFDQFLQNNLRIIDLIVYHQSGSYFIADNFGRVDSQAAFEGDFGWFDNNNIDKVTSYLGKLQKLTGNKIIWIGPFLEFRRKPTEVMLTQDVHTVNPTSIELFDKLDKLLSDKLQVVKEITYVRFNSLFFEPKKSFHDSCFVFRDTDHYSLCGEKLISKSVNKDSIGLIKNKN
ncbi:MAG: acyltransferase [gamma proteobacterium symbiont of Ctena orbiculata]